MDLSNILSSSVFLLWILSIALGLFFLWKVLSLFFDWPVWLLTMILVLLGTNYFSLVLLAGPTANAFLFTLFLAMILLTTSWQKKLKWLPLFTMLPVMIMISFLSGPAIFILFFPILTTKWKSPLPAWGGAARQQWLFLAAIFSTCIVLRQFSWFTHPGADFYFGNYGQSDFPIVPANIHRVLFSDGNGWLIHTPLVIFASTGFYFLAEKNRVLFTAVFLFILAALVAAASNPTWWFADRFGYPNLVETYAVLCLPLGYFIQWAWTRSKGTRILLFVLSGILISLNLFQTWQFQRSILLRGRMTEKYCCASDTVPDAAWIRCTRITNFDFENPMPEYESFRLERAAHRGKHGLLLNPQYRYSPGMSIPIIQLTHHDSTWIKTSGYFFFTCKNPFNKVFLVVTCLHQGTPFKYKVSDLSLNGYHPGQWNKVDMSYLVPFPVDPGDLIQVYFMDYGGEECFIDDFEINLCKPAI